LNELVLWLGVAPIVNGNSVEGAPPMYAHGNESDVRVNRPPIRYTSTNHGSNHLWNIPYIEQFIRISTGALATASSGIWPDGELVTMTSFAYTIKLDPNRSYLLIVLPGIIFASGVILFLWTKRLHSRLNIPIMRKATLSEFLKSAQTKEMREVAEVHGSGSMEFSQLDDIRVKFERMRDGSWGLVSANKGEQVLDHELHDRS
jgi:hypothetical protein